jgi:hypothetical protein
MTTQQDPEIVPFEVQESKPTEASSGSSRFRFFLPEIMMTVLTFSV